MSTETLELEGQRVVLRDVSWETYERLLRDVKHGGVRLTYDDGELEIMTLGYEHEFASEFFNQLVQIFTWELRIKRRSGGSVTMKRKLRKKGLEPDKSFWFKNPQKMVGKKKLNLERDPPPDLVLEVDITSSSLDRMTIYAAMKVPEVWRYDGAAIRVHVLGPDGKYRVRERSELFPFLPIKSLLEFLQKGENADELEVLDEFRDWVRSELLPLYQAFQADKHGRGNGKKSK